MPKDFLTSGEFASLRNVNLNSLRYYEKLKILLPAWVDPETKYRYYRLEQLCTLDTILFFIEVGMPLKQLKAYIDKEGRLDQKCVLNDAKKAMEDKIASMKSMLATTEFDLMNMEQNRCCNEQEGIFTREIGERSFIVKPFHGEWENPVRREKESMELFHKAKDAGMLPTFPAGILVNLEKESVNYSFFVQVLRPVLPSSQQIIHIPKGTFSCMQFELTRKLDIPNLITEHFGHFGSNPVILQHILRDTHHVASRYMEIQIAINKKKK